MRSCSLPVDVLADVESSIDKAHSAASLDNTRGGESFRSASRGVRALRIWVSLFVWVRNGRFGCGDAFDGGGCSCDVGVSGGWSASDCGAVGRERISVMLRCLRIGFVQDTPILAWAKEGRDWGVGLGRGSQSQPGCNGPYSQVTSESLSLQKSPSQQGETGGKAEGTDQFRVSGLIVLSLFLCFHQVLQLAFSRRVPLVIAFFCLVMFFQELQTSSSRHWWER